MELRTDRLLIREFVEEDRSSVVAWRSDPEVMRWLDNPEGASPTEWFTVRLSSNAYRPRVGYDAAIVELASGESIGWIGIFWSYDITAGDISIGYALRRESWGSGYATEALGAVIAFAFGSLGARSVFAECYEANARSAGVMVKAGLRPAGEASSFRPELGNSIRHRVTREEWKAPHRRKLGLVLVGALIAVIGIPLALSGVMGRKPVVQQDDPRLLSWSPRGELAGDKTLLKRAEAAWREGASKAREPRPSEDIRPVWAGAVGAGTVVLLQSIDSDGYGRIAQISQQGEDDIIAFDRSAPIEPDAHAVAVEFRPHPTSSGSTGYGGELLRLLVAPEVRGQSTQSSGFRAYGVSGVPMQFVIPSSGMSGYWVRSDLDSRGGITVIFTRAMGPSVGVESFVVSLGSMFPLKPELELVDPTWGPMTRLGFQVYEDGEAAKSALGSLQVKTFASLAAMSSSDLSVNVVETNGVDGSRVVVIVRSGSRVVCVASKPVKDLNDSSVVAVGCPVDGPAHGVAAIVAKPDIDRIGVREGGKAKLFPYGETSVVIYRTQGKPAPAVEAYKGGRLFDRAAI